uniref:Uncharacterized protein n=1 Tax=Megaselia scalaris TaxID=36166 RepID=T1H304_MEGSC
MSADKSCQGRTKVIMNYWVRSSQLETMTSSSESWTLTYADAAANLWRCSIHQCRMADQVQLRTVRKKTFALGRACKKDG